MRAHRTFIADTDTDKEADRQTASLAGVAIIVALLVVGLWLVHRLGIESTFEDCLMSGRTNCMVIVPSS